MCENKQIIMLYAFCDLEDGLSDYSNKVVIVIISDKRNYF
jgi:hypothetical protein